ncbi:hypothetical protein QAD02_022041 [Eretmocerus hayati]|uniref:Uncharacterized protein n=1 Tax=Eretmocerus hayati TaxID=131215 RepID=A0ACC2PV51_9HYME|nr:hypothetical protein QAD02_022041 [Eretmocerus hayati]
MFLQNADNSDERINPMLMNKFLINKYKNRDASEECYPIANNEVCIVAKNLKIANEVLNLKEWQNDKKEIFILNHLKTRQGIIKDVPTEFRDLKKKTRDPETGKLGPAIPTKTVPLTFRGQYLPPRVALYANRRSVGIYYLQVRQCYRCFNFGHLKINCKSASELCQRCADPVHSTDSQGPRTQLQPQCKNCKKGHIATDKCCEARKRQQKIRDYATENNISVAGAKKIKSGINGYNYNANEYPSLSNRWSPLQESPRYDEANNNFTTYSEATTREREINKPQVLHKEVYQALEAVRKRDKSFHSKDANSSHVSQQDTANSTDAKWKLEYIMPLSQETQQTISSVYKEW